jgi:hypothetical protein
MEGLKVLSTYGEPHHQTRVVMVVGLVESTPCFPSTLGPQMSISMQLKPMPTITVTFGGRLITQNEPTSTQSARRFSVMFFAESTMVSLDRFSRSQ